MDRDERLRQIKDRQNEERQRKLEELKAQAIAAQKYREQKDEERKRRIDEMKLRENDKRQQVRTSKHFCVGNVQKCLTLFSFIGRGSEESYIGC